VIFFAISLLLSFAAVLYQNVLGPQPAGFRVRGADPDGWLPPSPATVQRMDDRGRTTEESYPSSVVRPPSSAL
jgi:hypothetical protein